jgi:chromosome segregation ATPase
MTGPQHVDVSGSGALDVGPGTLPDMAVPDDIEARVTTLETQMRELSERVRASEQDAAAARVLAGGADRDVTEIRGEIRDFRQATTSSFNAMREDLTDLRQRIDNGLADVRGEMHRGFAEMRGKLDTTAAGQQQIVTLLNTIIGQQGDQPNDQ